MVSGAADTRLEPVSRGDAETSEAKLISVSVENKCAENLRG